MLIVFSDDGVKRVFGELLAANKARAGETRQDDRGGTGRTELQAERDFARRFIVVTADGAPGAVLLRQRPPVVALDGRQRDLNLTNQIVGVDQVLVPHLHVCRALTS